MIKRKIVACAFIIGLQVAAYAQTRNTSVPPKGWNSWDSYGMYPTEKAMMANLEVMAKRLKPFGYEYFVIDAGWNKIKNEKGKITGMSLDEHSRFIPAPGSFPNGMKPIADKAHALGLKFGIHIMRGVSRRAYVQNMPILNSTATARSIADTSSRCPWSSDNYGVNMKAPGAQAYYDSYITLLASWGVDFIKVDDITGHPDEILAVVEAINKTGKKITLSLSPGSDTNPEHFSIYKKADMLRVTYDIWDDQLGIDRVFEAWKKWSNIYHNGFWLDMDMIAFGHLNLANPDPNYLTAKRDPKRMRSAQGEHMSFFTTDQKYLFITMRALTASPLFMGGDLPTSDEFSFELLTNRDMLACNENGIAGSLVSEVNGVEIWKVVSKKDPRMGWIGIFNRSAQIKNASIAPKDLGLQYKASLLDIWKNKAIATDTKAITINAGGVLFMRYAETK